MTTTRHRQGKTRRSKSRPGKRPAKTKRWLEYTRARIEEHSVAFTVDSHPSNFLGGVKCQRKVRDAVATLYPGVEPHELPKAWEDDATTVSFSLTPEMNEVDRLSGLVKPPLVLVRRYDSLYDKKIPARFVELYDAFIDTAPVYFAKKADPRSSTLALHLGVWQFTSARAKVTRESREQASHTIKAMDELLQFIKINIIPKINNRLAYDFPEQWKRALKVRQRLLRNSTIKKAWTLRPALDLGPAICSIAIKDGSSEIWHLDFSDDPAFLTWLFVAGKFVGGDFCSAQLGKRFPIGPGQLFAVRARYVVHCSAPYEGRRVVMTGFMESTLLRKADRDALESEGIVLLAQMS